jgi:hypothetical protein
MRTPYNSGTAIQASVASVSAMEERLAHLILTCHLLTALLQLMLMTVKVKKVEKRKLTTSDAS